MIDFNKIKVGDTFFSIRAQEIVKVSKIREVYGTRVVSCRFIDDDVSSAYKMQPEELKEVTWIEELPIITDDIFEHFSFRGEVLTAVNEARVSDKLRLTNIADVRRYLAMKICETTDHKWMKSIWKSQMELITAYIENRPFSMYYEY